MTKNTYQTYEQVMPFTYAGTEASVSSMSQTASSNVIAFDPVTRKQQQIARQYQQPAAVSQQAPVNGTAMEHGPLQSAQMAATMVEAREAKDFQPGAQNPFAPLPSGPTKG